MSSVQSKPLLSKEYISPEQSIVSGGSLTLAHGMGVVPKLVKFFLKCEIAEDGYSVGEIVEWGTTHYVTSNAAMSQGLSVQSDGTNIYIRYGTTSDVFSHNNWDTGAAANLTNTGWKLIIKAYA